MKIHEKNKVSIIMLGTAIGMKGGVSSVIETYEKHGFFETWPITYIPTHIDGGIVFKFTFFIRAWITFLLKLCYLPDIIHIHTSSWNSFWRKLAFIMPAHLFRRPIILHLHGGSFDTFFYNLPASAKFIVKKTFEKCACVIVLSEEWEITLREIFPKANLVSIPNPISIPDAHLIDHSKIRTRNFLFLGRLEQQKGTYDLINAFNIIAPNFSDARLLLGGDGEIDKAKKMIEQLNLTDRIEVLGWVSGDIKAQLLLNAIAYVLPSYAEGLPIGILEAMSYGLPIIATPVGGIPSAIREGQEGLLIPKGDVQILAGAMAKILENPDLTKTLGTAARRRAEQLYSTKKILNKLGEVYQKLLK